MVTAARGPDVALQRLRQSSRADDAHERTGALRELLRMDWRRARDVVMAALASGAWGDRALILRALVGRGDPLAKEALPFVEAAVGDPGASTAARALAETAAVVLRHDQTAHARALCEQGLALAVGGDLADARARHVLGAVIMRERDARGAQEVLRDAVARYEALGERVYMARALDSLGSAQAARFDLAGAERSYTESLALKVAAGDRAGEAITLGGLGRLALQRGDLDAAAGYFERDLAISRELGDDEGMTVMANQLGEVWLRKALDARRAGDEVEAARHVARARQSVEAGVDPGRRGGSLRDEGFTQMMQGRVSLAEGRHDEADRLLARAAESFAVAEESAARHGVELLRAEAARARGDHEAARAHVDAAIASFEAIGSLDGQVRGWMELALQLHGARHEAARREALARAGALAERLPPSPASRAVAAVRAAEAVASELVARGLASREAAAGVVDEALTAGRSPGATILRRGLLDRKAFGGFVRDAMGVEVAAPGALASPSDDALACLAHRAAARLVALPLARDGASLRVAVLDPLDAALRDQLALLAGCPVVLVYAADEAGLGRAIRRAYGRWLGLERCPDVASALRALVEHATSQGASAAVLDPAGEELAVRVRIDDVWQEVDRVGQGFGARLAAEAARAGASALPTTGGGARVSLRIGATPRRASLAELGFGVGASKVLARAARRREGLVLVAGPAGSGRTTTLRALLAEVDLDARAAVAVGGAAGVWPDGVVSIAGVGASAVAAVGEQEADVVVVDALDDAASLREALRLVARGRVVIAALRDDSAAASPWATLERRGVSTPLAEASLAAFVAQRLLRRLCAGCKVRDRGRADAAWLRRLAPDLELAAALVGATLYARSTVGCAACGGRGYLGRALVYGLWGAGEGAAEHLLASAVDLLASGATSRDELARVFG